MFSTKLPPSSNPFTFPNTNPSISSQNWVNCQSQHSNTVQYGIHKRQQFRLQIRNRQIQQYKKQIRFKQTFIADPNDYNLLKNINLNAVIGDCLKYGLNQQRVHCMFLYSSSKNMEHINCMIDDKLYHLLIDHLIQPRSQSQHNGIKWNRKIFWILTNYTSYTLLPNDDHLLILYKIAQQIYLNPKQHSHNQIQQAQQNIVLSISNMFNTCKSVRYILKNHRPLINLVLRNLVQKRDKDKEHSFAGICLKWAKQKKKNGLPRLLVYYAHMLNNLYTAIDYYQLDQQQSQQQRQQQQQQSYKQELQPRLVKQIVKIMFNMLGGDDDGKMVSQSNNVSNNQSGNNKIQYNQFLRDEQKKLTYILLQALTVLFGHSLDNNPQLILTHKKQIIKLGVWFEKFLKTQQQSSTSDQLIIKYLSFLQVIYGPNIPQQYQNKIYKLYINHFQSHVGIICTSLFKSNNPLFHTYTLRLLQPILLQQVLSQMILNNYLVIISHIFQHLAIGNSHTNSNSNSNSSSKYAHKKQSLICLVNFIKSTLYNGSQCVDSLLEILLANNIADVFAGYLWAYVDQQLNHDIIQGIQQLLQAEKNQYGAKLQFWLKFQQASGTIKLNRILQQSSSDVLKHAALKVLDMQKANNQQINY